LRGELGESTVLGSQGEGDIEEKTERKGDFLTEANEGREGAKG
jgi:hypothetical protein